MSVVGTTHHNPPPAVFVSFGKQRRATTHPYRRMPYHQARQHNLPTDLATDPAALLAGVCVCALDGHANSVACAATTRELSPRFSARHSSSIRFCDDTHRYIGNGRCGGGRALLAGSRACPLPTTVLLCLDRPYVVWKGAGRAA